MLIVSALVLAFATLRRRLDGSEAWLLACSGVALIVACSTPLLGICGVFSRPSVLVLWSCLGATAVVLFASGSQRPRRAWVAALLWLLPAAIASVSMHLLPQLPHRLPAVAVGLQLLAAVLWLGLFSAERPQLPACNRLLRPSCWGPWVLVLLVLAVALLSVPRTYDALTYHAPRVFHWIQNRSVAYYPTPTLRQNYVSPLTGYLVANLLLLDDTDAWFLWAQWLAYLIVIAAAWAMARRLGGNGKQRTMAVVLVATAPNVVLLAPTALTDLANAAWILLFAWAVLRALEAPDSRPLDAALVGSALGLAVLSKATAYPLALPLLAVWTVVVLRRRRLHHLALAGICFLALNAFPYYQSSRHLGDPLASGDQSFLNADLSPPAVVTSLAKHLSVHLVLPVVPRRQWTAADPYNRWLENRVLALHRRLGVDPAANNMPPGARFGLSLAGPHPQAADSPQATGSPAVLLLLLGAVVSWCRAPRNRHPMIPVVLLCTVLGFLLLAATLRWQPWIGRFHVTTVILAAILAAVLLPWRSALLQELLAAALCLFAGGLLWIHDKQAIPAVLGQPLRSLYVEGASLTELAEGLVGFRRVGMVKAADGIEYPWIRLVRDRNPRIRVDHAWVPSPPVGAPREPRWEALVILTQGRPPPPAVLERARREGLRERLRNRMGVILVRRAAADHTPPRPSSHFPSGAGSGAG